jgi:hypothetical protein
MKDLSSAEKMIAIYGRCTINSPAPPLLAIKEILTFGASSVMADYREVTSVLCFPVFVPRHDTVRCAFGVSNFLWSRSLSHIRIRALISSITQG